MYKPHCNDRKASSRILYGQLLACVRSESIDIITLIDLCSLELVSSQFLLLLLVSSLCRLRESLVAGFIGGNLGQCDMIACVQMTID